MKQENFLHDYSTLPPEAKNQVADFIAFLKTRYGIRYGSETKPGLSDEPFIGIWRNREDMSDSSEWVRSIRKNEWAVKNG